MSRTSNVKKDLGAFYTPYEVTSILANWAIQNNSVRILEPSFGGCSFLEAINQRIHKLSSENLYKNLYGCDIDPIAFVILESKFPKESKENFLLADFLQITPLDFANRKFDVIIGNPPYISNHNMSKQQKETAFSLLKKYKFPLNKRASLWAYFLLHSLNFMQIHGRCAWILPESFLFAGYSKKIREYYFSHFKKNIIIQMNERLFVEEGTDEKTLIILSEDFNLECSETICNISDCDSYMQLNTIIKQWEADSFQLILHQEHPKLISFNSSSIKKFSNLFNLKETHLFGDFAEVKIGIVTGANKFFIVNSETIHNYTLNGYCENILSRFKYAQGISLTKNDFDQLDSKNERIKLVNTRLMKINNSMQAYLDSFPIDEKEKNYTFKHKSVWHENNDRNIPDAFFPYMDSNGPTLVLNQAHVNATNTIHRIYFNKQSKYFSKLLSISMLSSFSQISAELEGRIYGSSMLKHEPKDIVNIKLLIPQAVDPVTVSSIYKKVDKMLRNKLRESAISYVDVFLSQYISEYSTDVIKELNLILYELRRKRKGYAK